MALNFLRYHHRDKKNICVSYIVSNISWMRERAGKVKMTKSMSKQEGECNI